MNCVLHVMLTFEITLIYDMKVALLFLLHFFCRSYVVTPPCKIKNIIASTEVVFMFVILTKNRVLHVMLIFEITLIFLYER